MTANPYTKELSPIISEFLRLTRMEEMTWKRIESGVYESIASNGTQRLQIVKSDNPINLYYGIKLIQDDACEFDYYTDEGHQSQFDSLLVNLFEAAEHNNAQYVKQQFDNFLSQLKK